MRIADHEVDFTNTDVEVDGGNIVSTTKVTAVTKKHSPNNVKYKVYSMLLGLGVILTQVGTTLILPPNPFSSLETFYKIIGISIGCGLVSMVCAAGCIYYMAEYIYRKDYKKD